MYLHAIASAVPERSYSQKECWDIFEKSQIRQDLKSKTSLLVRKILLGESGVSRRHFALDDVDSLFDYNAEALNQAFEREAPALASRAMASALQKAGIPAADLDGLFICTCTGYLCPGISSHVAEQLGIGSAAFLQDLVGLGCGAAIPTLRAASHMLAARPDRPNMRVAVVAVEICSAAFFLDNDIGVIISACIFGDGASASIWGREPGPGHLRATGFDTIHSPEEREYIRFVNCEGKLRNRLHRSVPERAVRAVSTLWDRREGASPTDRMISHGGGRDVIEALEAHFPDQDFSQTAAVLENYGNMSSPSVLFALERELNRRGPAEGGPPLWLTSFGAGFSAHSCFLRNGV